MCLTIWKMTMPVTSLLHNIINKKQHFSFLLFFVEYKNLLCIWDFSIEKMENRKTLYTTRNNASFTAVLLIVHQHSSCWVSAVKKRNRSVSFIEHSHTKLHFENNLFGYCLRYIQWYSKFHLLNGHIAVLISDILPLSISVIELEYWQYWSDITAKINFKNIIGQEKRNTEFK